MNPAKKILCVFDLDGTLIDSKQAILDSAVRTLESFKVTDFDHTEILESVGLPIRTVFQNFLQGEILEKAVNQFRSDLLDTGESSTFLFDDTNSTLEKLHSKGVTLAVATNKYSYLAKEVLKQQKIEKYFDRVVGADTSPPKPSPDMLKALESEFPQMDLYVMVGDRGEDMMAAKSAGFFSYFIDHGTIHSSSLPSDLTDRRLASLDEIVLYIEEDWNLNRGR